MKSVLLIIASVLFSTFSIHAQDKLTKRNGEVISAKIIEVGIHEIKYKKFDAPDGPSYIIPKFDIESITYPDGSKDTFETTQATNASDPSTSTTQLKNPYLQGTRDAKIFYDGHKSAGTGTLIVSLLSPLVGLAPAFACSASSPKYKNLQYPSVDLMKNQDYSNGYQAKAKKIKQGKVWMNWAIGLGANIIYFMATTSP